MLDGLWGWRLVVAGAVVWSVFAGAAAEDGDAGEAVIGFTQLRTDLPGGRHANVRTMRAMVVRGDGTRPEELAGQLVDDPDAWTQFAGWSPDGRQAIVLRGWQDPENAKWEEEHGTFRMEPGKWLVDTWLVDVASGRAVNVTAVGRVSHYNSGVFFLPEGGGLGFTALIDGVSRPWVMDLDGGNKRDASASAAGFAYGFSASPDGTRISYHENYQIYVSQVDGSEKRRIETGNPFNFGPSWSADGEWLLFVSGAHYDCHPHIVRGDGTGLRKLADRNGYRGVIAFLDVADFHGGSSDTPVWAVDGKSVFYTATVGESVELFRVGLMGEAERLTTSPEGSLHYHPTPSKDGRRLLYGAQRDGVRQLWVRDLESGEERRITNLQRGSAAMWGHWRRR